MIELYNDDCFNIFPSIPDKSVDLICCDPPYQVTSIEWDKMLPFDILWSEYKRVLKSSGTVLIFGVGVFTAKVILSNEKWYKQTLIWNKNKCGSPGLAKVRPMQVTEDIVVFSPSRTCYNPQMEEGVPYSRKSKDAEGYTSRCNTHSYGLKPVKEFVNTGTRYPKNILNISRNFSAQQQRHPTEKPVPLLEWLILTYSNKGDIVLDNCMGVGACGVAAVKHGRSFVGIEKEKQYFDIAVERISDTQVYC